MPDSLMAKNRLSITAGLGIVAAGVGRVIVLIGIRMAQGRNRVKFSDEPDPGAWSSRIQRGRKSCIGHIFIKGSLPGLRPLSPSPGCGIL